MTGDNFNFGLVVGAIFGCAIFCALLGFGPEISHFRNKVKQARAKAEEYEESWFV